MSTWPASPFRSLDHRPWPQPESPWVMGMTWTDLLFAHWPVPVERVRELVPPCLEVDTWEGEAWLGVVPFRMSGVGPPGLGWLPGVSAFPELNVRTYVVRRGKPGVWFFSLDAASRLAVRAARAAFRLPYFDARMRVERQGDRVEYRSRRIHRGAPPGEFDGGYAPAGEVFRSRPGSIEHWLTERYALYTTGRGGRALRGEIDHEPWPLQEASAELRVETVSGAAGFELGSRPALLHYADRIDVVAWWLTARD